MNPVLLMEYKRCVHPLICVGVLWSSCLPSLVTTEMSSTLLPPQPQPPPASSSSSDIEICTFDLDEIKEYVDLSSFRFMLVTITGTKIAIATPRYLVIMEEVLVGSSTVNSNQMNEKDKIQTVVEFGEISGRPTAIQWLNQSILCVGFETGALTCFNDFGETMSEHEFSSSPLMAIHVLPSVDPTTNTQHIWALYENGFLISVSNPCNGILPLSLVVSFILGPHESFAWRNNFSSLLFEI